MYFDQVEFGKRLRELRLRKGMTLEDLGEILHSAPDHMRRIERGTRGCSIDLLLEIAMYFNVSTDYLLTGKKSDWEEDKKRILERISELTKLVEKL